MKKNNHARIIIGIIAGALVVSIVGIALFVNIKRASIKIKTIGSLHFASDTMNDDVSSNWKEYDLWYTGDDYLVTCTRTFGGKEAKIRLSTEKVNPLIAKFNEYKIGTWDGFDRSDADSGHYEGFSFSLVANNNTVNISANGSGRYPKNYREIRDAIDDVFEECINEIDKK